MSGDFSITRSTSIDAPVEAVYRLVDDFREWTAWSPWEGADPALRREYSGADRGVGASYAWSGNREAGAGSMEIVGAVPGESITIDLRFTKPFKAHNTVVFAFREVAEKTEVTWTMTGKKLLPIRILNVFGLMSMDTMIGPDFEKGLADLKRAAEAG